MFQIPAQIVLIFLSFRNPDVFQLTLKNLHLRLWFVDLPKGPFQYDVISISTILLPPPTQVIMSSLNW